LQVLGVTNNEPVDPNAKVDGKWEILSNWNTCSLACGGGV